MGGEVITSFPTILYPGATMTPTQQKAQSLGIVLTKTMTERLTGQGSYSVVGWMDRMTRFLEKCGVENADISTWDDFGAAVVEMEATVTKSDDELEAEINTKAVQSTREKGRWWEEYQRLKAEFERQ